MSDNEYPKTVVRKPNRVGRRVVRLTESTATKAWSKLWAYSYTDLADLFGITERSVRLAVAAGRVDPGDLHSICRYWVCGIPLETEAEAPKTLPKRTSKVK